MKAIESINGMAAASPMSILLSIEGSNVPNSALILVNRISVASNERLAASNIIRNLVSFVCNMTPNETVLLQAGYFMMSSPEPLPNVVLKVQVKN